MRRERLDEFIADNPDKFVFGGVISEQELVSGLNIRPLPEDLMTMPKAAALREANNYALRRLGAYGALNKVLIDRGLVISQRTDRDTFEVSYSVATMPKAIEKVKSYKRRSASLKKRSTVLRAGLRSLI